jgi:hypothetical protein
MSDDERIPEMPLWFRSKLYRDIRWWAFEKWEAMLIRRSHRYYRWRVRRER